MARFSLRTILTATLWLEERHQKTRDKKVAMAIALHYLMLALREDARLESKQARAYCARAVHWQSKACESTVPSFQ
jgi:hypothetical protein